MKSVKSCGNNVEKSTDRQYCNMSGCDHIIEKDEVFFKVYVNMGQGRVKHVRICAECLLSQASKLFQVDPDLKEKLIEKRI